MKITYSGERQTEKLLNGYMTTYFSSRDEGEGERKKRQTILPSFLVVDDDEMLLKTIALQLTESGYRTNIARDYQSVRAKMREFIPDVFLIDYSLPGKDGIRMWQEVKQDERVRRAVGVIMSAYTEARQQAERQRVAFIDKPFAIEELLSMIGSLERGKQWIWGDENRRRWGNLGQTKRRRRRSLFSGLAADIKRLLP
ncbi:MAG: response regulator [Candidatus Chisholmbacteria bacterium]|nr:response regulator [Candidatus Chisholmbacteria bacterium]